MLPLCNLIFFLNFNTLNKLGLVGGFSEYPIIYDFKILKKIINHDPVKPVQPVINTFLFNQNLVFKII